jgi:hypothetical protein
MDFRIRVFGASIKMTTATDQSPGALHSCFGSAADTIGPRPGSD